MELFKYNPTPYVNTQVDLPLDFLQGQLETKQKEFDAQSAATDKAAENFLKITPGMLTKEAYERVKNQYLPQIEKIRDTLHQTGNISQAAPDLSKFTMNLAADPEVKNIMQDYELTKTHNQAMQEGRYTKLMLPGLFNKEGQQRAQVGPGQTVQSSWYAPYEHVDPVEALRPEIKDLNARIDEGTYSWYNPATNETVTDRTKLKILKPQIIADFVRKRKDAFLSSPESKGYVVGATDWGSRAYTDQDWERDAVQPLSMFDVYEQETERTTKPGPTVTPPSTKTDGAGNTVTPAQAKSYAFTTADNAFVPQVSSYLNPEVSIKMQDELDDEILQTTKQLIPLATAVYQMTGVNTQGRDANSILQDSGLRQQARDNWNARYVKNDQGHYIPKVTYDTSGNPLPLAPNVTPQQEQAFEQWGSLTTSIDSAKGFRDHVKETAGVDNYDPAKIKAAKESALQSDAALNRKWKIYQQDNWKGNIYPTTEENKKYWKETQEAFIEENKADYNKVMAGILGNSAEGKIYKVWDELNTRMERMQMVNFDNDKSTESILGVLLTQAQNVTLPIKDFLSDKRLDRSNLDDKFTANIPINKTTGLPDYSQIHLGMAFDRKDGLVGIITMGGKQFEFDISKNPESNLDKLLIEAHPELKEPTKFFHQVYESLNQTSGTRGKFNLGANTFVFDHKSENLGKGAPKFEYEYDFDGTGKKRTSNLYEIYSAAAGVNTKSVQSNSLQSALTAQQITSEYTRMVNAAGMDRKKIQEATNWYYQKQDEALKEQLAREKASVGKTMGKGTQFRQTPKTPLR
jgi:hypothetical protein